MDGKGIRVRVYGTDYPLRVDDEDTTKRAASKVDGMMQDLHAQIPEQPSLTLAVLAALNVAESLEHSEQQLSTVESKVEQELRSISRYLEENIEA